MNRIDRWSALRRQVISRRETPETRGRYLMNAAGAGGHNGIQGTEARPPDTGPSQAQDLRYIEVDGRGKEGIE